VHGSSDTTGAAPADNPSTPADVTATVFSALGLDPHTMIHDQLSRPWPISEGKPIRSLFA
jgi:hypothetical protein